MRPARVIVVGAGIAGLSAAFRLRRAGLEVTVLEAASHAGGRMFTAAERGFLFDTGAIVLSRRYAEMRQLAAEAGLGTELVEVPDVFAISHGGRLHRVHAGSVRRNLTSRVISARGKFSAARLAGDVVRQARRLDPDDLTRAAELDVVSVREYVLRRAGRELYERLIEPMYRGLYLEDPASMSAVDFIFIVTNFYGAGLFTFRGGVGALAERVAGGLDVRLGQRATEVVERHDGIEVTIEGAPAESADACVIALPARQMAAIHLTLPAGAHDAAHALQFSRILTIQLALDSRPGVSAVAMMFSRRENLDLCSIYFDHAKSPAQAPAGHGLLTVFWDHRHTDGLWDTDDDHLIAQTADVVARAIPGYDPAVRFGRVTRHDPGIVVARPGAYTHLRELVRARDNARRIHLAGDYLAGGSTNSAVVTGERAARAVCDALGLPTPSARTVPSRGHTRRRSA